MNMNNLQCWRLWALLAALLVLLAACGPAEAPANQPPERGQAQAPEEAEDLPPPEPETPPEPEPESEPEPAEEARVTLVAVGDNLLHNTISWDAELPGGGYDFTPVYQYVKPWIQGADLAFLSQEVPLNGTAGRYPNLDAPQQAADAAVDCGFDVVNQATNHALDKGMTGLENTLKAWAQREMPVIGAFLSPEEAAKPCLIQRGGLTFGFLGYTYGTNGIPIPEGKEYAISLIDEAKIQADIQALRPQCDYLVVSMHWGAEYQQTAGPEQQELAQKLADWGADLIVGSHPHVLQPAQWIEKADGGRAFCAYSLGNFVSSQNRRDTMLGGMLGLTVVRDSDGTVRTENPGILPIVTYFERKNKNYRVYPLEDYTAELASRHAVAALDGPVTPDYCGGLAQKILGDFYKTKETFSCQP